MKNVFKTALLAAAIFIAACNNPTTSGDAIVKSDNASNDGDSVKAYIKKEALKWGEEVRRGDSTAMAAHYSSDAILMPSNSEPVKGKDILGFWGGALRMGVKDLKLEISDISGGGDIYVETGNLELLGADNKLLDRGKYIVVWKKENGNWKMYRDIWNSNLPAPGAK